MIKIVNNRIFLDIPPELLSDANPIKSDTNSSPVIPIDHDPEYRDDDENDTNAAVEVSKEASADGGPWCASTDRIIVLFTRNL